MTHQNLKETSMFTRRVTAMVVGAMLLGVSAASGAAEARQLPAAMEQQVASAQTKAEHEAIAQRFDAEAAELDSRAAEHEKLATLYQRGQGGGAKGGSASLAHHCESFVKNLRESAAEARELAKGHREAAAQAPK
jgi:hypothetical protein